MDAHFSLPDGGSAHIGCSMFSSSVLRLHAEITGDNGKISVFNPFAPQHGHRMKVTTSLGTRKERFSRKASYDFQLEAFVAAVEDGASFPTTAADAIRTMELIDAIYTAAGLPVRQPTADRLMPLAADDLTALADAALDAAAGCQAAELRVERIRSQTVRLHDAHPETTADDTNFGMGVRVVVDGAVGFAATVDVRPEEAANLVRRAREMAKVTEPGGRRARRAGARAGRTATSPGRARSRSTRPPCRWPTRSRCWPSGAGASPRTTGRLAHVGVAARRVGADVPGRPQRDAGHPAPGPPADAARGAGAVGQRLRDHAHAGAAGRPGLGVPDGPLRRRAPGTGTPNWRSCPSCWREKLRAPSVEAGTYDLVVDPSNLWLTIHESIGHATELDRAVGYEAAYAGTSFATFDKLGSLAYGSPVMHVTGDRTVEHGLATVGIDDEGVEAQSFDLVRDGTLVGYQLDRSIAASMGFERSNGCAFADSPMHVPIQRMANVSLAHSGADGPRTEDLIAGVDRGIYIVGDKSWSIDMQRYNFQFTGQRFYRIEGGKLAGQVKDVAYQATTTDFWGAMEAVGGASTWVLGGAFNCGKGQPGQVAPGLARLPVGPRARCAGAQHARGVGTLT